MCASKALCMAGSLTRLRHRLASPRLSPEIASLVGRVNAIDKDSVRLQFTPDRKLGGKFVERKHLTVGQAALALLKSLIGLK